ncbi:MAG: hypothetical protein V7785_17790 [Bermanella sp.]
MFDSTNEYEFIVRNQATGYDSLVSQKTYINRQITPLRINMSLIANTPQAALLRGDLYLSSHKRREWIW